MKPDPFLMTLASAGLVLLALLSFPPLDEEDLKAAAQGNRSFALDLYKELSSPGENLFFSPYSISIAFAMTYGGARGETERQMARTLHFSLGRKAVHAVFARMEQVLNGIGKKGEIQLEIANALWPQKGSPFLKTYLDLVKEYYGAVPTPLDYMHASEAARQTINQWVEEKTKNRIRDLIQPGGLDAVTQLVLVNAIYFKGDWASRFSKTSTRKAPFYLVPKGVITDTGSGMKTKEVMTMFQEGEFRYGGTKDLEVLELPYAGGELSMVILLPRKVDGLKRIEGELNARNLEEWTRYLRIKKVKVFLPRFEMTSQFNLSHALTSLGMIDAFREGKADFSGMDGQPKRLYIDEAMHKAFIKVNEEGSEAAAATGVVIRPVSMPGPPPEFRADHPFLFFIRHNATGTILFLGSLWDPVP